MWPQVSTEGLSACTPILYSDLTIKIPPAAQWEEQVGDEEIDG
jgi:hypothetical protein